MKKTTFSKRLRQGLELTNMKPAELSRITNISKSSISHYLKGDWEGKQDAVYRIARALGVSEAWLMGFDVPREKQTETDSLSPIKQKILEECSTLSKEELDIILNYIQFLISKRTERPDK